MNREIPISCDEKLMFMGDNLSDYAWIVDDNLIEIDDFVTLKANQHRAVTVIYSGDEKFLLFGGWGIDENAVNIRVEDYSNQVVWSGKCVALGKYDTRKLYPYDENKNIAWEIRRDGVYSVKDSVREKIVGDIL